MVSELRDWGMATDSEGNALSPPSTQNVSLASLDLRGPISHMRIIHVN